MFIEELKVLNFRNLAEQQISFNKHLNIIHGNNGQGKTSVLEAIYLIAITKSFRVATDKVILQYDREYLDVSGRFKSSKDTNHILMLRLYYSEREGKHIFLNGNKISKFSEIIGTVPVILLSLEDLDIMYGLPGSRRKFVDIMLAQVNPLYLKSLQKYKQALAQRNKLLSEIKEGRSKETDLQPWDVQLIEHGAYIVYHRQQLKDFLNQSITQFYQQISDQQESIWVRYQTNILKNLGEYSRERLEEHYLQRLTDYVSNDIERENTLNGPHRDDFIFLKDNHPIKTFGSQGENKTCLIALKLAESAFMRSKIDEKPIFLLDDIFGELDEGRIHRLLASLDDMGQIFITTTLSDKFDHMNVSPNQMYHIENGMVWQ
ncbi:MAG: DNA replication/repair protein RecF [Caldithrix sp.]|nr:DNA replication/repair protein RecF [Caldithrix sp.]